MTITLKPVAYVANIRREPVDDEWGSMISTITLADDIPTEAFGNISSFSHLEIIFYFDKVPGDSIVFSGRPRENPDFPLVGIFAQRKKDRPNKIGLCTVELLSLADRTIIVKGLDAIDGTPVIDIKPVFQDFMPKTPVTQPEWVSNLMKNYW